MKTLSFFFLFFLTFSVFAEPGGKMFADGKKLYDQGKYKEAIGLFDQAITENAKNYNSKGNYMIALCYKKSDACSQAKIYFKKAYDADPKTGGASSLNKFKDELNHCNTSIEEIMKMTDNGSNTTSQNNTNYQTEKKEITDTSVKKEAEKPSSDNTWLIISALATAGAGGGGYLIYKNLKQNKQRAASDESYQSEQLYNISEILFDDNLWLKYANEYGEDNVQRIRTNWQLEFAQVNENKEELGYNQLLRKIRLLETNPSTVFNNQNP